MLGYLRYLTVAGSIKQGFHYGSLKADESELQWHQSYHGTEFPWPETGS
jgi:hypothetical protein